MKQALPKGADQKRRKGDKRFWFADKRIGTVYRVSATPYNAHDKATRNKYGNLYWVKPHMAEVSSEFEVGRGLHTNRNAAYAWLIGSYNDDIEKITQKLRRAAVEIAAVEIA